MMSATLVSAGAASSGYYNIEGYYAADSPEAQAAAEWYGQGASELGLTGRIDEKIFASMLKGQTYENTRDGLVEGRVMGRYVDGERQHRPGLDLTFSPSKSVSIAALVFGDERVIAAHDKAVRTALSYVEKELVQTRRSVNGEIEVQTGGKIIAGLFRHDTSRLLDPQVHTHAVVANMVRNPDGSTTALHNNLIFNSQKIGSEIYRNDLALELNVLGYTVERSGKDRLIEIKEVPRNVIDQFSKRRAEIESSLNDRGMDYSAKSAELAALATRAAKSKNVDREELRGAWIKEATSLGLTPEKMASIIDQTKQKARFRLPGVVREGMDAPAPSDAVASLRQGIEHVSERAVHYSEPDVLTAALVFARSANLEQIQKALVEAKTEGFILPAKTKDADLLTDRNTLQLERDMSRLFRMGQKVTSISLNSYMRANKVNLHPNVALSQRLERTTLTNGQKEAVQTVMTGKGRVVGVQGYAGTGKTFALAYVVKEAKRAGYTVEGLGPSSQAVKQLKEALPSSETIQARLLRSRSADKYVDPLKTILVVDEASMVSNRQMLELLKQAEEQKIARVVLVGDVQQLDGVAAGTPFALLQGIGMRTSVMDDIQRQRNDEARAIVQHAISGDVQEAFKKIGNNITVSRDVATAVANKWLLLDEKSRDATGIVTPTNKTRTAINEVIREGLREEGKLAASDHVQDALRPLRFTRAQVADPRSYTAHCPLNSFEGDMILAHQSVASAGISRGHVYEVIEQTNDKIIIRDREGGKPLPFAPAQNSKLAGAIEVYSPTKQQIAEGDEIKFRITDKDSNIENGDTARIEKIYTDRIQFRMQDNTVAEINRTSLAAQGIDHAYALTAHDYQGKTVDDIIVAMTSKEIMANQKGFYVAVSRARDEINLVTDSPERLASRLENQTGQKISALEAWIAAKLERAVPREEPEIRDSKSEREDAERREDKPSTDPEIRDTDHDTKERERESREEIRDTDRDTKELEREAREEIAQMINADRGDFER